MTLILHFKYYKNINIHFVNATPYVYPSISFFFIKFVHYIYHIITKTNIILSLLFVCFP